MARIERCAKIVDQTAVATELLKAATYRKNAETKHWEEMKIQCEKWLRPSNVRDYLHQQLELKVDGTCDWILSYEAFRKWSSPDPNNPTSADRLLFVSGNHGCGKSILSSSITAHLEKQHDLTLYFSFSSTDISRLDISNLIRTLLWQLLQKGSDEKGVNTVRSLMCHGQPVLSELWETFCGILIQNTGPTFCIIDGVDECNDLNLFSRKFLGLLDSCTELHIMMLGRPHAIQVLQLPCSHSFQTVDITPSLISQDIGTFIENEITGSNILRLPEIQDSVIGTLKEQSDGMFLWVKLMVNDLQRSSTQHEVAERLQNLPRGLEEAYQATLQHLTQRLDSFELHLAQTIFAFVCVAYRPLSFDELSYAWALVSRSATSSVTKHPLDRFLLIQPVSRILDICGGLIFVRSGSLNFIHSSVREYLTRPLERWISESGCISIDFRITVSETHSSLTLMCLDYLGMPKEERVLENLDSREHVQRCYPFLGYATMYTFYHLNRLESISSSILGKIKDVLDSVQGIFWLE